MSAIDIVRFVPSNGARVSLASRLAGLWQAVQDHRTEKRVLRQLSRYEPRLLRDMGLDPAAIYAAHDSVWDDVARRPLLRP